MISLEPFAQASTLGRVHVIALPVSAALGAVLLFATRGRPPHKLAGWAMAVAVGTTFLTGLNIQEAPQGLPTRAGLSPVDGMLAIALALLGLGVFAARRNDVFAHRALMSAVFCALLTAVLFSVLPGGALYPALTGTGHAALAGR